MSDKNLTITVAIHSPEGQVETKWTLDEPTARVKDAIESGLQLGVDQNGFWVRNWDDHSESFATIDDAAKAFLEPLSTPERHEATVEIVDHIKNVSQTFANPADFITYLQGEIEYLPGAAVTFVSRDIAYLRAHSYLEDRGEVSDEDLQSYLNTAASKYEENAAIQDGITYEIDTVLDRNVPYQDDEEGEE